ncbi:MAG: 1-acyl-sn-glycerol-3-phosphate acyltransferase, partial [Magnetospirillum sp.]|nr:1-acyl-sn-glycerol-3-phosphate acyltransferase [Magnetospirillum sp.]
MTAARSVLFFVLFQLWTAVLTLLYLPLLLLPRRVMVPFARLWVRGALVLLGAVCGLRYEFRGGAAMPKGPV